MKYIIAALLLLSLILPAYAHAQQDPGESLDTPCGQARWNVKTLSDAVSVNLTPKQTTIADLRRIAPPAHYDEQRLPRQASERQVYRVRAKLIGWKIENDHDFHIVIADPGNPQLTMIVEPPDPSCESSQRSGHAQQYAAVREAFLKCFGEPTPRFRNFPNMLVDVDGVAFWDAIHGQRGAQPSVSGGKQNLELHPLLRVVTVSGTCPN